MRTIGGRNINSLVDYGLLLANMVSFSLGQWTNQFID